MGAPQSASPQDIAAGIARLERIVEEQRLALDELRATIEGNASGFPRRQLVGGG